MRLYVKVAPKAARNAVTGWVGDCLKVSVRDAPERGRANAAVEAVVAASLNLPAGRVRIVSGQTSSRKWLEVDGLNEADIKRRLEESLRPPNPNE